MAPPYQIIEAKDAAPGGFRMERRPSAAEQPAGPARAESEPRSFCMESTE